MLARSLRLRRKAGSARCPRLSPVDAPIGRYVMNALAGKMRSLFGASDDSKKESLGRPHRDGSSRRPHRSRRVRASVSVITLGIEDLARSMRFYTEGFGWTPVIEDKTIVFYQMNGLVLGTWLASALADDMRRAGHGPGSAALARTVRTQEQ